MMSEECITPRCRGRGNAEESEVEGVFVEDFLAVYELS
jgi:CobQ-like glutamine amidotransferase family enzyme